VDWNLRIHRVLLVAVAAAVGFASVFVLIPSFRVLPVRTTEAPPRGSGLVPAKAGGDDSVILSNPGLPLPQASRPVFPPEYNFALAANGSTVTGGKNPFLLIDGDFSKYSAGSGFAMTQWNADPPQSFVVTLKETSVIDCIRFLLWDKTPTRFYRYKLETSDDELGWEWQEIADRTKPGDQCKGWQNIVFKARPVKHIRLTGVFNSENTGFQVVELQAFLQPPAFKQPEQVPPLDF
jgi:hypothetical protein